MIKKAETKDLVKKFIWKDIDMEIIAIKAIGNHSKFIFDKFTKTTFYNPKNKTSKNYDVYYRELLDSGKCIFYLDYLIFKEGFEKEYLEYVSIYLEGIKGDELVIYNELEDKSSFGKIKSYIAMFKNGAIQKETLINMVSKSFKNPLILNELI